MADVPFHEHQFDLPTANASEITAGERDDVAVSPRGLKNSGYYATKDDIDGKLTSVVEGTGINIDYADPLNPVISATAESAGDVAGPSASIADRIAVFNGTTGKIIKDGGKLLSDLVQVAGAQTVAGLKSVSLGTAITPLDYFEAKPTDFGTGKPAFKVTKTATANLWRVSLYDGVNNAGSIDIDVASFTWKGASIVDVVTAQVISGLKTVSLGLAITNQAYLDLRPIDFGTGKPAFQITKDSSANIWNIRLFDGTDNSGTIRLQSQGFLWNGNQISTLNAIQQWSKPQYSGISPLPSAATITIDGNTILGNIMSLTLGTNATLANPTNLPPGLTFSILGQQDATGGRTIAYGSSWVPIGATVAPAIPSAANAKFRITGQVRADGTIDFAVAGVGV